MTLRVKLRGGKQAFIRFDQLEGKWFVNLMCSIRDSDPKTHPPISIRDKGGEIPKLSKPKSIKVDPGKGNKKTGELPLPIDLEKVKKLMR